jgi:hypothetical protein
MRVSRSSRSAAAPLSGGGSTAPTAAIATALLSAALLLAAAAPASVQAADPPQRLGPPMRLVPQGAAPPAAPQTAPGATAPSAGPPPSVSPSSPTAGDPAGSRSEDAPLPETVTKETVTKDGTIAIDKLAPVAPDWTGPLGTAEGGLPPTMWQATPRALVAALLPSLQLTTSPAMQDLGRRLLLSNAAAPAGPDDPSQPPLLAKRLDRLAAFGQTDAVTALLRDLPARQRNEATDRLRVEQLFLGGDRAGACEAVADGIKRSQGVWWDRALIACQALNGEHEKASLGLGLLREQKAPKDDAFDALVEALANRTAKLPPLKDPTPLHLALLEAWGQPLPADAAATWPPALLAAWARGAADVPAAQRLPAAERAAAFGLYPVEKLRELYGAVAAEAPATEKNVPPARSRALLYAAAQAENGPAARADRLAAFLATARGDGEFPFPVAARVVEPMLAELNGGGPDMAHAAPDIARALLALGKPAEARAWIAYADPAAATALVPLARLAQGKGGPPFEAKMLTDLFGPAGKRDEAANRRATLLLALLAALGDGVGPADWASVMVPAAAKPAAVPMLPAAVWLDLGSAAADRRPGEVVLTGLVTLADGDRLTTQPVVLARAVEALMRVGLEREARSIAVEAAISGGL